MEQEPDAVELMHRHNHGVDVFLMWHRDLDILSIVIKSDEQDSEFVVPNDKGLKAFEHPFAFQPKGE